MSGSYWVEPLSWDQADGVALANSTTPGSILSPTAKYTLAANYFNWIGKKLRLRLAGRISVIVTTPGTLLLDFRLGSVVAFTGGAMALNVVAKTNVTWEAEIELEARTVGNVTTATLLGIGRFTSEAVVGSAAGVASTIMLPASAPVAGTGFDSTAAQQIDVFGTWSIANAGNSILTHQTTLEALN